MLTRLFVLIAASAFTLSAFSAPASELAEQQALLRQLEIKPDQLKALVLDTTIVDDGKPQAVICSAADPAWLEAAAVVKSAILAATGAEVPIVKDIDLSYEDADAQNVIVIGHLENNRHVARLYHNFFVCLDEGFTGSKGYVLRSVHDPFGTGHNYILVGGSGAEGTRTAAEEFTGLIAKTAQDRSLTLGRLLVVKRDAKDALEPARTQLTETSRDAAIEAGRSLMFSPGQGRSGVSRLVAAGVTYHRTGNQESAEAYRGLMQALLDYYRTDEYINSEGLSRYDRDFRDAWTHEVAITWDLLEESGVFSDDERLQVTNLLLRLGLECVMYQGWDRPDTLERWRTNTDIVHNHNTFPALGVYFTGNYLRRHYGLEAVGDWLDVAHGIFNGQKHSSKPLEDAAGYQWLPIIHTIIYSLAEGDHTFFDEGHALQTARVIQMVMDNAGYQAAYGDHSAYKSSSAIGTTLQKIAWYHKDPQVLWGAMTATGSPSHPLDQAYHFRLQPQAPQGHDGVTVSTLPRACYDYAGRSPQYPAEPNLPFEQTFDKLTFRSGMERDDAYLLLDGFGRGTHMHFDANSIIRFSKGGEPLLVDGEYIKNAPKYHNSMVIIRDGSAVDTPAVTGLAAAVDLPSASYARTWVDQYNGARWDREILWLKNGYAVVSDQISAQTKGDFTLRCCWRPWGQASIEGSRCIVKHPPMQLTIANANDAPQALEVLKTSERLPISRLSQQVSLSMDTGDSYRFTNVICADKVEQATDVTASRVGEGLIVIRSANRRDLMILGKGTQSLEGVSADAVLVLADELLALQCTALSDGTTRLRSDRPVSFEVNTVTGSASIATQQDAAISLECSPEARVELDGKRVVGRADGNFLLNISAGNHEIRVQNVDLWAGLRAQAKEICERPAIPAIASGGGADSVPSLTARWSRGGFASAKRSLPIQSVSASVLHSGRYGPVEKLFDGQVSSSTGSVMWPKGEEVTLIAEMPEEFNVTTVRLREWHMNEVWDIGGRTLAVSSDGFKEDVREIDAPFEENGTETWGSNTNTFMEAPVKQKAKQIRLVLQPARDNSSVYLAEIEIFGDQPGARPRILAMASARTGDAGGNAIICGSEGGEVSATSSAGEEMWTFTVEGRAPVNSVAAVDVDGDGRDEIAYGADNALLGLLSIDGKELWGNPLPQYRGITSHVQTVFGGDVTGDGVAEVICGCSSWQYFAFDAAGKELWRNVIYAHSATVGQADDLDGDGKDEVIAGNAYYVLNLIDDNGSGMLQAGRFGPEQTAVASGDVDADGTPEVAVGTDSGDVLCFTTKGTLLWETSLGDKVTRILPVDAPEDGQAVFVCAAESANVFAIAADGEVVWRLQLPDGSGDLTQVPGARATAFVAAAGSAGVIGISRDGQLLWTASVPGVAQRLSLCGDDIVATTSHGEVHAFPLPGPPAE